MRLLRLVAAALVAFLLAGASASAAPSPGPDDAGFNAVGRCLADAQVWLLVVSDDGTVLANQCVGRPASGSEALAAGGVRTKLTRNSMICSMNDIPAGCRGAAGTYWNYWQGSAGEPFRYSEWGADNYQPVGGAIEAWCLNTPGTKRCTPPMPVIEQEGTTVPAPPGVDAVDLPVTANEPVVNTAGSPLPVLVVAGVLVLVGVAIWAVRRRGAHAPGRGR